MELEKLNAEQLHQRVKTGQPLRDISLADGDYRGLDLSYARFERVDARGANFSNTNLDGSTWMHCQLDNAYFTGCCITSLNLSDCSLHGGQFIASKLKRGLWLRCGGHQLNMQQAQLDGLMWTDNHFTNMELVSTQLTRLQWSGCNLMGLQAQNGNWEQVRLTDCSLIKADLHHTHLNLCAIEASLLQDCCFSYCNAGYLSLYRCRGDNLDFTQSQLECAILSEVCFKKSDFTAASMKMACLNQAQFEVGSMDKVDLSYASCRGLQATQMSFISAELSGTDFHAAICIECDWSGADRTVIRPTDTARLAAECWQPLF